MTTFIAIYRGDTVAGARIVAMTADPEIVQDLATRLLGDSPGQHGGPKVAGKDAQGQILRVVEARGEGRKSE
jgi:hypothetical protein